jgi:hypothetical protein
MAKAEATWTTCDVGGRPVEVLWPGIAPQAAVIWLHAYDEAGLRGRAACERAFVEEALLLVCPKGGQSWWLDRAAPGVDRESHSTSLSPTLSSDEVASVSSGGEGDAVFTTHRDVAALTPARYVIETVVEWIGREWSIEPPRIGLAGVGMGGQGAVNLGFRHARKFPVVVAIAPDIDFHQWHGQGTPLDRLFSSREAARQQTATLHLHPLNWPRLLLLLCDPADPVAWEGTERLASKLISSGVPFECDFQTRAGGHSWSYFEAMIPVAARFLGRHLNAMDAFVP